MLTSQRSQTPPPLLGSLLVGCFLLGSACSPRSVPSAQQATACPAAEFSGESDPRSCVALEHPAGGSYRGFSHCEGETFRSESIQCGASLSICANLDGCADCGVGETCVGGFPEQGCRCLALCSSDDDCAPTQACLCVSGAIPTGSGAVMQYYQRFPSCVPAECRTDEDCEGELRCGVSADCCGYVEGLFCQREAVECEAGHDGWCRFDDDLCDWRVEEACACD